MYMYVKKCMNKATCSIYAHAYMHILVHITVDIWSHACSNSYAWLWAGVNIGYVTIRGGVVLETLT